MNQTLIHADIFFFITTIAVIILVILLVALLAYAVKIVRTVSFMTTTIKEESENIVEDISALRQKIKEESTRASATAPAFLRSIGSFLLGTIFGGGRKQTQRTQKTSGKTKESKE